MNVIRKYIKEILKESIDPVSAVGQYAHRGQKRRSGEPYFSHPAAVAQIVSNYYPGNQVAYNAAILHDTFEDAIASGNVKDESELIAYIHDAIPEEPLSTKVIDVVLALTKQTGEDYSSYIQKILNFPDALIVKLADMRHNLGDNPKESSKLKYSNVLKNISDKFGGPPPFVNTDHWNELREIVK